jgi:Sister chromatid cohesion protein Dcc1
VDDIELQYTYLELLERIQASEAELGQGLEKLKACLIDGIE